MSNDKSITTPFVRRLAAVGLTYRTRPLTWVIAVVYLAAVLGIVFGLKVTRPPYEEWIARADAAEAQRLRSERLQWDSQHRLPSAPPSHRPAPQWEFAPPEIQRSFYRRQTVVPEHARTIAIYDEAHIPAAFWDPSQYPHVETVITYGAPLSSETLRKLVTTYRLKALYLNRCDTMTADDMETLARVDSLQVLSLDGFPALTESTSLKWPRNLHQLAISTQAALPVTRFQEWRALPQLRSLIVTLPADQQSSLTVPDIVAELDAFPQRPTLYLDVAEGSTGEWAAAAQPDFHRIAVRPKFVSKSRWTGALYACFALMLPMGFGAVQLAGQSLQPLVALGPKAGAPHCTGTAIVWVLGGLVTFAMALSFQVSPLSALALGSSGPLVYFFLGRMMCSDAGMGKVMWVNPFIAFFPLIFIPATIMLLNFLFGQFPPIAGEMDWFLRGEYPWLALGLITASLTCVAPLMGQLSHIRRSAEESGFSDVPLSAIDQTGWQRATTQFAMKRLDRQVRWNPIMRGREQRIEHVLNRGPALTRSQRIAVWMCGLILHPLDFTILFILLLLFQTAILLGLRAWRPDIELSGSILYGVSMQVIMAYLIIPIGVLSSRRRWMEHELLFPLSRRDWIRDWFTVQAWMLAPLILVLGLMVTVNTLLGVMVWPPWWQLALVLAGLAYLMTAAWIGSLRVATWTSWHLTVFTISAVCGLFTFAGVCMTLAWITGDNTSTAEAVLESPWAATVAVVLAIVGLIVLIRSTYRRWQTWEVGRLH